MSSLDQFLLAAKAVTPADVARARDIQKTYGGQLGEILIRIGAAGEDSVLALCAEFDARLPRRSTPGLP